MSMESTNGDMPAMPMDSVSAQRADEGHYDQFSYGLTKREHFAAMVATGKDGSPTEIAEHAVRVADALLKALEAKA